MTEPAQEQELVEQIAKEGATAYFDYWDKVVAADQKDNWLEWAKGRIMPLIKKAGYKSPEEVKAIYDSFLKSSSYTGS